MFLSLSVEDWIQMKKVKVNKGATFHPMSRFYCNTSSTAQNPSVLHADMYSFWHMMPNKHKIRTNVSARIVYKGSGDIINTRKQHLKQYFIQIIVTRPNIRPWKQNNSTFRVADWFILSCVKWGLELMLQSPNCDKAIFTLRPLNWLKSTFA